MLRLNQMPAMGSLQSSDGFLSDADQLMQWARTNELDFRPLVAPVVFFGQFLIVQRTLAIHDQSREYGNK
jgi:hypothetical protein